MAEDLRVETTVEVVLLLASPRHRYEGRPADGALPADGPELRERIELRAGLGIVGDRYYAARAHVHATVTVIGVEGLEEVSRSLGATIAPAATRRNVVLRGADVEALRGEPFSLQVPGEEPVLFRGYRPANPCAWMATRSHRGRSVRCGDGAGSGATRSPTGC